MKSGTKVLGGRYRRRWMLVAVILVGVLAVSVGGAKLELNDHEDFDRHAVLLVSTEMAEKSATHDVERVFIGQVEPVRESDIGFELEGKVVEVLVDEGDQVKKGQVVARLDVDRLRARRDELRAESAKAKANLRLARITFKRLEGLVSEGAASHQAVDDAREKFSSLKATAQLAESRIRTNGVELEKSELRAPFDGFVTRRLVDEGRVLATGEPALRLVENASPEARVGLAGGAALAVAVGQAHEVTIHDMPVTARVKAVLPVRSASKRTVDAILALNASATEVRAGDLVKLSLRRTVAETGFWVPLGALTSRSRGLWSVYVAEPLDDKDPSNGFAASHRLARRTVSVLHMQSDRVFVRGGLTDGDSLVRDGVHRVVPRQLVRINDSGPAFDLAQRGE